MSAVSSRLLRYGAYSPRPGQPDEPDVYGHVVRHGLHVDWSISLGRAGTTLDEGRAWTKGGAWAAAITASARIGGQAW